MRDLVAEQEAAKYREAFTAPQYRRACHGLRLWQERRDLFPATVTTATDFGCGTGRLVGQWLDEGIDAVGVDFAANVSVDAPLYRAQRDRFLMEPLWSMTVRPAEIGVCADVLEHIPKDYISRTLQAIAGACRWALLQVAHMEHVFRGHTLHVTVRDAEWWLRTIRTVMRGDVTVFPSGDDSRSLMVWSDAH